jgi:hypothetical protein
MKKFKKLKCHTILKTENVNNTNVLMALMQAKNNMGYTPFFYLCDRDQKTVDVPDNYEIFPDIIKDLIK